MIGQNKDSVKESKEKKSFVKRMILIVKEKNETDKKERPGEEFMCASKTEYK